MACFTHSGVRVTNRTFGFDGLYEVTMHEVVFRSEKADSPALRKVLYISHGLLVLKAQEYRPSRVLPFP